MVDVVSDQTEISYAESTTGWGGDSFVLEPEIKVQGSNSVAVIQTSSGINEVNFTGSWDMSGSTLRMYMSSNIMPNTDIEANGGIEIFASDGTNTAVWTVGGSDTYSGGWTDFFVDVDSTPTSGSVNSAAVTQVGIRINTITKPRNSTNGWYDNWRFGNGLTINSTTTEAINFTDVANEDGLVANKYDILEYFKGVIYGKGEIILGDAGAKNCNLVSNGETLYFEDANVSTSLYKLKIQQATGLTDIDISNFTCKTVGPTGAELDFSISVNSFKISASSFTDMGEMTFNIGSVETTKFTGCGTTLVGAAQTLTSCSWSGSGTLTLPLGASLDGCVFNSTLGVSAISAQTLETILACDFVSDGSSHAVELTSLGDGSFTWNGITTGYDAGTTASPVIPTNTGNEDIYVNVAAGTLTISVSAGATIPSIRSAGATVNVVSGQVTLEMTIQDEDKNPINLAQTSIQLLDSPYTQLMNKDSDISGIASEQYSFISEIDVVYKVRKSEDTDNPRYFAESGITKITADGLTLTITLKENTFLN